MSISKILVGTTNPGKVAEFEKLLAPLGVAVVTPNQVPAVSDLEVDETGETFQENALLKATAFAAASGIPTLAEDSGLTVTALDGMPGVHSKRFFAGSDLDRNHEILRRLDQSEDRAAQFVSVLAFVNSEADDSSQDTFFEGIIEYTLADEPRGDQGFGYDPILIPVGQDKTLAQLGPEFKNKYSHRAASVAKFIEFFKEKYGKK